jgi:hypothetical protein
MDPRVDQGWGLTPYGHSKYWPGFKLADQVPTCGLFLRVDVFSTGQINAYQLVDLLAVRLGLSFSEDQAEAMIRNITEGELLAAVHNVTSVAFFLNDLFQSP